MRPVTAVGGTERYLKDDVEEAGGKGDLAAKARNRLAALLAAFALAPSCQRVNVASTVESDQSCVSFSLVIQLHRSL